MYTVRAILSVLLLSLVTADNVHAYLDPGSGSYFAQVVIAFLVGGLFFARSIVQKIKHAVRSVLIKKQ